MIKKVFVLCMALMIALASVTFADEKMEILGDSAILMDADTGRILYAKEADEKIYPASTTKIMTAAIILEEYAGRLDDVVVASDVVEEIIGTGASNIGILPGEELTIEQLLYAVLVASANEACDVLAEHMCHGDVDAFVELMNNKAKELGMENTHFSNTHGFHDENHYTTAKDMAILARYAMQNETFRKIVKTPTYTIPKTNKYTADDGIRTLANTSDLIKQGFSVYYKYATGIKTGYTSQAGNCLVASATKENTKSVTKSEMNLIAATFDVNESSGKYEDVINLFEYGFKNFNIISVSVPNEDVGETDVYAGRGTDVVTAVVESELKALLPVDVDLKNEIKREISFNEKIKAPVKKGEVIGSVKYTYTDPKTGEVLELGSVNLVSKTDIERDFFKQIGGFFKKIVTSGFFLVPVIVIALIIFVLAYMRNLRKRRRRRFLRNRRYRR